MNPDDHHNSESLDLTDAAVIAKYEPYLRMLARSQARRAYQAKHSASDVVQQVMLQAVQGFDGFRGGSEGELRAWLRQILTHHLCHLDRDMHRGKRDVRREQSIQQAVHQSSMRLEQFLAEDAATPSQNAVMGERCIRLAEAIERLPDGQREAIRMHHLEGLKLSEIAECLDKSSGAIAGLLHRGMKQLRRDLDASA